MLTGKERAYLKSLAHNMDPLIQLGKDGINDGFLKQIDILLEDHEIVKINVLQNAPVEVDEIVDEILDATGMEFLEELLIQFTLVI